MDGNERLTSDLDERGSCDCSYAIENVARFRVNIFKQSGRFAIVMRKLQTEIPTLERAWAAADLPRDHQGKERHHLLTGGTGSGKTTTLAAMLNELNRTQEIHILTLEDPIEFLHPHQEGGVQPAGAREGFLHALPMGCAPRCARRRK